VEGIGVNKGTMTGLRLGAIVEDPDNLFQLVSYMENEYSRQPYRDHGQQDVASSGGFKGSDGRVH
jgi:hypothetical protein